MSLVREHMRQVRAEIRDCEEQIGRLRETQRLGDNRS